MTTISWIITGIAVLALLIIVIITLAKENKRLKKENRDITNEYKVVYNELKKAEQKKEKLNTGNDSDDFNNTVDVLSDLARRVY